MGTTGFGILEDDSAMDIYYEYMGMYNLGSDPHEINHVVQNKYAEVFGKNIIVDNTTFWVGLALAQWECKALGPQVLENVRRIVAEDIEQDIWEDSYSKRKAVLTRLLAKILKDKKTPKRRVKPIVFEAPYRRGDCLLLQYPDGLYGGAICLAATEGMREIASSMIAVTRIRQPNPPYEEDFLNSHILVKNWGTYNGQIARYATNPVPDISVPGISEHNRQICYDIVARIKIDRSFGNDVYGGGFGWDFARWAMVQFKWEADNPELLIDKRHPVRTFIAKPPGEQGRLGEFFVATQGGREFVSDWTQDKHVKLCRAFVNQAKEMGFDSPSDKSLNAFVMEYAGCSSERAENRLADIWRNSSD